MEIPVFPDIVLITFYFSLVAIEIKLLHGDISVATICKQFFYVSFHRAQRVIRRLKCFETSRLQLFMLVDIEIKGL